MEAEKSPAAKKPAKRLLLADDSTTVQKVVNLTFADEGIEVVTVGDGNAAMEKFVEAMPDLVMVDVNMPGTGGYKICEIIKHDEETKHIPVILLVGSFEQFDEAEAERVGADGFLTKPFQSIRQLVAKVSALLDPNGVGAPSFADDDDVRIDSDAAAPRFSGEETRDETIQTNQIGSLPADEAQKFSTDLSSKDSSATKPLTIEDFGATEGFLNRHKTAPLGGKSGNDESASSEEFPLDFDAANPLELPRGEQTGASQREKTKETLYYSDEESFTGKDAIAPQISPEIIEQIAARAVEKLVEKLADKILKELTREIVPQLSQSIAEELSREHGNKS